MSALRDLLDASDLNTLTNGFVNMVSVDQLGKLKEVWQVWVQLSSLTGPWVTEQRNDAFHSDTGSEAGIFNYLNSIPKDHKRSAKLWMKDGLFASKCVKSSQLTRENVTLTSYLFQYEPWEQDDYDFNIDPSNLPFSSWDYKAMTSVCYNDSLPEMFSTYPSYIMNKCIDKLRSGRVKLQVILCDCMMIDPFLPVDLTYDRIVTSNLSGYISLPALLTKFKGYLNVSNSHSVLMTEMHNWVDDYLPEVKADIFLRAPELTPKVVKDTNNPLLVATGHLTSLIEYHNIIPDFQHYLRAAFMESHTETELESFRRQRKKLPSIKTIIADLGLSYVTMWEMKTPCFPSSGLWTAVESTWIGETNLLWSGRFPLHLNSWLLVLSLSICFKGLVKLWSVFLLPYNWKLGVRPGEITFPINLIHSCFLYLKSVGINAYLRAM